MMNRIWIMRRALRLAEKGRGFVESNPMVGAVIVNEKGERIGEGFHSRFGAAHAEVEALNSCREAGQDLRRATLFVTLEPCCHYGKTPPCTEAILSSGIQKVVIAELDPSDKVHGKGVAALKAAGIEVEVGVLAEEARRLNASFYCFHENKRPRVILKIALSLDGKVAAGKGEKTLLTGKVANRYVHGLRHEFQAILVGAQTVLTDDPHLGVREIEGRDPFRVIWAPPSQTEHERFWETRPQDFQVFRDERCHVSEASDLAALLKELFELGLTSVLVEGGAKTWRAFRQTDLWDESHLLVAPLALGDSGVPLFTSSPNHEQIVPAGMPLDFHSATPRLLGKDWLLVERR